MESIGVALLAGGKSRRMGKDKANLVLDGVSFLRKISNELSCFDERLLSVDSAERYQDLNWEHIVDQKTGCGPLGGLCSVLEVCQSEALLVVTCDLPLYSKQLGRNLCQHLEEPWDAVVPVTEDGMHPVCAVYRKRCLPILKDFLDRNNYQLCAALEKMKVRYIQVNEMAHMLYNVNTPEEYQSLMKSLASGQTIEER